MIGNTNLAYSQEGLEQSPFEMMLSLNSVNGIQSLDIKPSSNGFTVQASVQFPQDYRWHNIAYEFGDPARVRDVCIALVKAHTSVHDDEEEMSEWIDSLQDTSSFSEGITLNSELY